jgi:hypothetical protein
MLTSFWVICPHADCRWSGSLLPLSDEHAWHGEAPPPGLVVFQCPNCQGEWQAKIIGDDVVPLPIQRTATHLG